MLESIKVKNFGCFDGKYEMKFNKLNVIIGPNNSGKSTFFKALNLLRVFDRNQDIYWLSDYYSLIDFHSMPYNVSNETTITVSKDENSKSISLSTRRPEPLPSQIDTNQTSDLNLNEIIYIGSSRKPIDYQKNVGQAYNTQSIHDRRFNEKIQEIYPDGRNIHQFLLEKSTSKDPQMDVFEEWLRKIDPKIREFGTSVEQHSLSLTTKREDGNKDKKINLHLQGNGIQNAIIIMSAVIFSPKNSTIIIEEPELYQHSRSIEVLVDLFNYAVNEMSKQIIIVTHSWDIINAYCSDIGEGGNRGNGHTKANRDDFKLITVNEELGPEKIKEYDLVNKKYSDVRRHFKELIG